MNYFKDYMVSVCVIIILTSLASEILVDVSWSKYINLICGILFAVCLFNPVSELTDIKLNLSENINEKNIADDYVSYNFRKQASENLSRFISDDIKAVFDYNIDVYAELTDEGRIYLVFTKPLKENIYDYIKETYKPYKISISGE